MIIDDRWYDYATEKEILYLDATKKAGSMRGAARSCNVGEACVRGAIKRAQLRATTHGYSSDPKLTVDVPEPYYIREKSILYGSEGEVRQQWVKIKLEEENKFRVIEETLQAWTADLPRYAPIKAPRNTYSQLCNLYTFTDYHMGMLAWDKQSGSDWNIEIAKNLLVKVFEEMMAASPEAESCVLNNLGDFLHYDGLLPVTPSHGHILDADGSYSQMVAATIHVIRTLIDMALHKHKKVYVVMAEGNHDLSSSVWLRHMLKYMYLNEPRLTVNNSEEPYYVYQHGNTMLGFHHGHKKKFGEGLGLLFAAKYPAIWGSTTKRYIHTGHYHHEKVQELSGVKLIQHPTLASADAYAARGGWLSERQASSITYHSKYGKVGEIIITPEMVQD